MTNKVLILLVFSFYCNFLKAEDLRFYQYHLGHSARINYLIFENDSSESKIRLIKREKLRNYNPQKDAVIFFITVLDGNNQNKPLEQSTCALKDRRKDQILVSGSIAIDGKTEIHVKDKSLFSTLKIMNLNTGAEVEIPLREFSNEVVTMEITLFKKEYLLQ